MKKHETKTWETNRRAAILLFVAAFFFLAGFHEFLHNHKSDTCVHTDCPVFIFLRVIKILVSLGLFFLLLSWLVFFKLRLMEEKTTCSPIVHLYQIRGPPGLHLIPNSF